MYNTRSVLLLSCYKSELDLAKGWKYYLAKASSNSKSVLASIWVTMERGNFEIPRKEIFWEENYFTWKLFFWIEKTFRSENIRRYNNKELETKRKVITVISNSFHNVKMAPSFDLFSIGIGEQEGCRDLGKGESTSALEEECTKRNKRIRRILPCQLKWVLLAWKVRVAVSELLPDELCFVLSPRCLSPPPAPPPAAGLACMVACFPSYALINKILGSCLHLSLSIVAVTNNIFSLISFLTFFLPWPSRRHQEICIS